MNIYQNEYEVNNEEIGNYLLYPIHEQHERDFNQTIIEPSLHLIDNNPQNRIDKPVYNDSSIEILTLNIDINPHIDITFLGISDQFSIL